MVCLLQSLLSGTKLYRFRNAFTGNLQESQPRESIGGILANDMGLCKTLTVISMIVRTRNASKHFARSREPDEEVKRDNSQPCAKATLVIAPSEFEYLDHESDSVSSSF